MNYFQIIQIKLNILTCTYLAMHFTFNSDQMEKLNTHKITLMYIFQKNLTGSFNKNIESLTVYQCE